MTRILFLDVDGVLVTRRSMDGSERQPFDPEAVAALNRIIAETGCKIVLSSTWRYSHDACAMMQRLYQDGVRGAEIIGATPKRWADSTRGEEIGEWLIADWLRRLRESENEPAPRFVILDDDSDIAPFCHRHIKTEWETGLMGAHANKAIAMLME